MEITAVYVCISQDTEGEGLGVARQLAECRALAEGRGWAVIAEPYTDNDLSAYSGKPRPAYLRLLEDVRAGRVRRIVAWHPDRLHRSPLEFEGFLDLVQETGCQVETVRSGAVDLSTPSGRLNARVLGDFARYESEHKSDRVRAKLRQNAEAGKHHGGSRPYGWHDDRVKLDKQEAAYVRHAVAMLLGGNSMKAVVRALNEAGSRNTLGGPWQDVTLRNTLLRARNAGLRIHHGQVLDSVVGAWEPILERDTWDQVRLVLTDPSRRTNPGATGRTHLLSGIARCGVCSGPLRAAKGKPYKGVAATIYRCFPTGCVSRGQKQVDALVRALVCARLSRADAADLLRQDDETADAADARAEVERLQGRLELAAADHDEDRITRAQFLATTARLRARLADAERRVPAPTRRLAVLDTLMTRDDVEAAWDVLDVSVRRQVVALLLDIAVQPTRRGPGFRPESIKTAWRDDRDPLPREAWGVG
jgi:DNA invertase Pin-like site-specific DNA recombinase